MSKIFNPENHARLHSDERRKFIPPEKILSMMHIRCDDVLLDAGAGTGYFAIPAAAYVGKNGKVIAADISQQMLNLLQQHLPASVPVEPLLCSAEYIPLPTQSVDKILMAFVLHEVNHRVAYLKMLRNILKDDGKIFIVEWSPIESPMGPPLHERINKNDLETYFALAGFKSLRFETINDFQYFCEASKF
ncbi:Ubiquinone/menaquinone biosynthesis C-methyltransferase UbiE [anaerobic digester metagenome]